MLAQAISLAAQAFVHKHDKGGHPYILHCLHVMRAVESLGEEAMIVAVLHDLIEDTKWTVDALIKAGYKERTATLIDMLTHKDGESYEDYIIRTSLNPITRTIKMHDLRHNSDIMRMKGLRQKDFERLEKYHRADERVVKY